jgi:succinate dehydrogenase / fumarate reductase cytochrome b subunit
VSSVTTVLPPNAASRAAGFLGSTVGKKVVMAVTGIIFFGFVCIHMIGNLQVYLGPAALNHYAVFLRELFHGSALWIFRAVLLVSVALHVWASTALTLENWRARPVGYRKVRWRESDYASRTMVWSGPILALFVVYHIMHFTIGNVHPSFIEGDVYHNFITGFQVWPVSAFYILAMLALGFHLWHGAWSMLQTLGLAHPRYNRLRHVFAALFAGIVTVGNISFPVAVLMGWLR